MISRIILILFVVIVAGDLAAIYFETESLRFIFKPLIIPALAAYFLVNAGKDSRNRMLVLAALFFSWVGDILLMFESHGELYFLLGLSSFLVAHVFYILFFQAARQAAGIKSNPWLLLLVSVYYTSLILFLSPYLGDKEWPVRIYGVVISLMLLLALHMRRLPERAAGAMMCIGAVLFILSDSILAVNKFYSSFGGAGLIVMATYAAGQFFIVNGAAQYTRQMQKL
jgi:uncharacterized membrane protein YhhN